MEFERDSLPKGTMLNCIQLFKSVSFSAILGNQTVWETFIFGKQIKPAIKLNLEYMKQNERENQCI